MQRTDFAPVLSATSSRDSVWIISNISQLAPEAFACRSGQSWARRPPGSDVSLAGFRVGRNAQSAGGPMSRARDYVRSREGRQTAPTLRRQGEVLLGQSLEGGHLRVG